MRKLWHTKSIIYKIILVYLITAALPLMLLGGLYAGYLSERAHRDFESGMGELLTQSKSELNRLLTEGLTVSKTIINNPSIKNLLEDSYSDSDMVMNLSYQVLPFLEAAQALLNDGDIRLLHNSAHVSDVYNSVIYVPEMFEDEQVEFADYIDGQYQIEIKEEKSYFPEIADSSRLILTITRIVRQSYGLKPIAVVTISYPLDSAMERVFRQDYPDGSLFLLSSDNELLWSSPGLANVPQAFPEGQAVIDGKKYLSLSANDVSLARYFNNFPYRFTAYVPIPNDISYSTYTTLLAGGFILVSVLAIGLTVSSFILKRLKLTTAAMEQFSQGDFDYRLNETGADEVGRLSRTYNAMAKKIQTLLKDIQTARDAEKKAIYKSLINQVRPHFLTNALDAVRMSAAAENMNQISRHLEAIIHYLNYNIGNIDTFVTLEEELRSVTDYLSIYNLSKEDKIEFQLLFEHEIKQSMAQYVIPKFTVQPIVENSLRHGFCDGKVKRIFILIQFEEDFIKVSVEDNGCGINPKRLQEVQESLKSGNPLESKDTHSSIGLSNILQRLKLYYETGADLTVESFEEIGTIVNIVIPKEPPSKFHMTQSLKK